MKSVSATELAKLGKCEVLVRKVKKKNIAKASQSQFNASSYNNDTLRGEFAHFSYEAAVKRFMTPKEGLRRKAIQFLVSAIFAFSVLTLLALHAS